jgi:penicillin-binding protein 1C
LVGRNDLPPRLQRLNRRPFAPAEFQTGGPRIVYPPDGALIEWRGEEIALEANGGKSPLRWLVDGKPLAPALPRRPVYWQPVGIGFVQLAVIDAEGRSARSTVRLSP